VKGSFSETQLIKNHHNFVEKLQEFYTAFYSFLLLQKSGYQGMLYRESCKKIDEFVGKNSQKKYFLIGFNALNKAEEFIFQKLLESKNTAIYWDIDEAFLNSNHQAGNFMRTYKSTWKYFEKNPFKTPLNHFSSEKNIQIIGAAK
ncbi:MAG: PD-(D/E)XK nuclease family protein, partial [Polaribacter sp.]|nr:PD-(D/E)XK nuclease family protein [Polaribacter sp.]